MCGTARKTGAETCSYCGYIYEDSIDSSNQSSFNQGFSNEPLPRENENVATSGPQDFSLTSTKESLLKKQDNVIFRKNRSVQEGALLLTNRRLVFAAGKSVRGDNDAQSILHERDTYAIPLDQIANVSGNRGILRPSLKVAWHEQAGDVATTKLEFVQKNGPRTLDDVKNAISEWVPIIDQAARSEIELPELQVESHPQPVVNEGELRSHVLEELGDMQWKGFFQMSRDLQEKYGTSVDPDALENICNKLVKEKLVEQDKHGEFFKKISKGKK
jgi:hypothetical protein